MYNIKLLNFKKKYLLEELIKVFLRPDQYRLVDDNYSGDCITFNEKNYDDRNLIKQQIYGELSRLTEKRPEWGILTGIRPVKLFGETYEQTGSREKTLKIMKDYFYIREDYANLIMNIYFHQQRTAGEPPDNSAGVYIGIPFCPTRCLYCSFASNQVSDYEISRYLEALLIEVEYVGRKMAETGVRAETLYIGGGTPTTLSAGQLDVLIERVTDSFDLTILKEFTVEAGRPDTITADKLRVLKDWGVDRLSINPQSMKDKTLKLIGRDHDSGDIRKAFTMAKSFGFENINADVIAGLPDEDINDFEKTINEIVDLGAENITVHSLAVKRASRLIDIDGDFHYKQAEAVGEMLKMSQRVLDEKQYAPYYLYRQKHMAGAYENTGYCKSGKEGIYNIRIMDEHQTIVALGAGGITKVYYPHENRLERVPNVVNYEEYINRIDEMLKRKKDNLFRR